MTGGREAQRLKFGLAWICAMGYRECPRFQPNFGGFCHGIYTHRPYPELTLATAQASNSALLLMTLRDRAMDVYNELMRISL